MQRHDAIADQGQFVEIAGAHQNTAAAFGEIADQGVNLRLGGNVNALRRLIKQKHADLAREPFGDDDLLLIAAGQHRGPHARLARPDIEQLHQLPDQSVAFGPVKAAARAKRSRLGSRMLSRTERFITSPRRRSSGT